jgi:hypothetical protein
MTNWQTHEDKKRGRSQEHIQKSKIAALEKRKLAIIKQVNELDGKRTRLMQSYKAINEQIVELEKGQSTP